MEAKVGITCPTCDRLLIAPTRAFGKKGRCKHCRCEFVVQPPTAASDSDDLTFVPLLDHEAAQKLESLGGKVRVKDNMSGTVDIVHLAIALSSF